MNPVFDIAAFRFDDPFGPSADPARYVPREQTERALAALEARAIDGRRCALLAGLPGIGKTLLLRILRSRFGSDSNVVHLRYPALPAPALFAWALQKLDAPGSYDPVGALIALAAQRASVGGEIVLLVDDAETLPEDSARALLQASRESGGALRFVAAGDRRSLGRLAEQIEETDPILLVDPMSPKQTEAYVHAHLTARGFPAAGRDAFTSEVIAALHRTAGGIPARVNAEASRVLRRALGPRFVAPTPLREPIAEPKAAAAAAPPKTPAAQVAPAHDARVKPGEQAHQPASAPELDSDAAFERAAGRLLLAHQAGAEDTVGDAALERAAGRLALANPSPPDSAEPLPVPRSQPADTDASAVQAATPSPRQAPPRPAQRRLATAATRAPEPQKSRPRKQPPLSVAASIFCASAAAGVLISVRLLETGPSAPEVQVSLVPRPQLAAPVSLAPVSSPPPEPIPVQINAQPWAEISIDGAVVGVTPLAGVLLTPGLHRFEARFPDGALETRTLEVDTERRYVTFPASPPGSDTAPAP